MFSESTCSFHKAGDHLRAMFNAGFYLYTDQIFLNVDASLSLFSLDLQPLRAR